GGQVQFEEGVECGSGRSEVWTNAPHREGHDADPSLTLVCVNRELGRDERAQLRWSDRPVHEEELAPPLSHERQACRSAPYGKTVVESVRHASLEFLHAPTEPRAGSG